jgi:hypothetical protein
MAQTTTEMDYSTAMILIAQVTLNVEMASKVMTPASALTVSIMTAMA